MTSTVETAGDIRPFHVDIPDAALEDLRRRVAATNCPGSRTSRVQRSRLPADRRSDGAPRRCLPRRARRVELTAATYGRPSLWAASQVRSPCGLSLVNSVVEM